MTELLERTLKARLDSRLCSLYGIGDGKSPAMLQIVQGAFLNRHGRWPKLFLVSTSSPLPPTPAVGRVCAVSFVAPGHVLVPVEWDETDDEAVFDFGAETPGEGVHVPPG